MAPQTSKASETVLVGCKLPNGLILQCSEQVDTVEQVPGGSRTIKVWHKAGPKYQINGVSEYRGADERRNKDRPEVIFGSVFTAVPKDVWDRWVDQHKDTDFVKNGFVYAVPNLDAANSEAKNREGMQNPFAPIDPDRSPVKGVTPDDGK